MCPSGHLCHVKEHRRLTPVNEINQYGFIMKEAKGNILTIDCDAIVCTTNGFVKANGECVMGKGIAKQLANHFASLPRDLGKRIKSMGNIVHWFTYPSTPIVIVSFPVKPVSAPFTGNNAVNHMSSKFRQGASVPGWACKAEPELIKESLYQLVHMADEFGWTNVCCPRFGCGAGELAWEDIAPMCHGILDDRFTAYTY